MSQLVNSYLYASELYSQPFKSLWKFHTNMLIQNQFVYIQYYQICCFKSNGWEQSVFRQPKPLNEVQLANGFYNGIWHFKEECHIFNLSCLYKIHQIVIRLIVKGIRSSPVSPRSPWMPNWMGLNLIIVRGAKGGEPDNGCAN